MDKANRSKPRAQKQHSDRSSPTGEAEYLGDVYRHWKRPDYPSRESQRLSGVHRTSMLTTRRRGNGRT